MSHHQKQIEQTSEECKRILGSLVKRVSRVRIRLIIEAVLQTLALGLVVLPIYVFVYAWVDHHVHLGVVFRSLALAGLLATVGWLLVLWGRVFLSHISLSRAANYIESRHSYQQQLVAAIEYYEQAAEYPYSRGLAEQMIRQINKETKDDRFIRTVRRWPTVVSSVVVLCAFICIGYLIGTNYTYYSRYFTRLIKPVVHIKPLPATDIETLSGDIIAEPRDPLVLVAAIKGRIPESGTLYIDSEARSDDPNDHAPDQSMSIPLLPGTDENEQQVFQSQLSLREKGNYRYYFKTGEAKTETHKIRITEFPKIESITANVAVTANSWVEPYTEEVQNKFLSVFEGSHVTLDVKVNQPLKNADVMLPDRQQVSGKLYEANTFSVAFDANEEGELSFTLANTEGLENRKPITLQMRLKQDMPPTFELISPGSDYIANNVASIPIEFKVSDDFALIQGSIHLEFNDGNVITLPSVKARPGSQELTLTYLLELEDYDLDISDSIIFYASAKDADTHIGQLNQTAWSAPYFVEIRPYRKIIRQPDPSMSSMEKQGLQRPRGADNLLTILEYNRAFLKKTWMLSQKKQLQTEDKSRMDAISDDITYAGSQLEMIRDNPRYGFTEEQIDSINGTLDNYDRAAKILVKHQPKQAVPPEKAGYYDLRKLVKELSECPPPVAGMPPETRDRLELKDPVHLTRYEKERIEWQMEKLAQELAELAKQQQQLREEFVKFLEQQKKEQLTQKVNDAKTWTEEHETENPRTPPSDSKPGQQDRQVTVQGAMVKLKNPPPSAPGQGQPQPNPPQQQENEQDPDDPATTRNENKQDNQHPSEYGEAREMAKNQQNQSGSQGQGQKPDTAITNEMMRMMQAQQKTLQDRINQLSKKLAALPIPDEQIGNDDKTVAQARQAAKEHLEKAADYMAEFEKILSEQYYQPEFSEQSMGRADGVLEKAQAALNHAEFEMAQEFASDALQLALGSENVAKQLEDLANAYEQSISETEKQELQELLQQATAMLETLPENWTQSLQETSVTIAENNSMPQSQAGTQTQNGQNSTQAGGQTLSGSNTVGKAGGGLDNDLIERARSAARHFWSVSIHVRKKTTPLTETQYTHPEYTQEENNFFEKTATYEHPKESL